MSVIEGIIYMLWRGFAIGVIISAPMGPVGILCVQRTLEKGRRTGFFTGVGAAISDMFYCLITGFGLSFIEDFLKANQNIIQLIGSVVLVFFGIYLFKSNPARNLKTPEVVRTSRRMDILQGFLFTFSNPLIIFLIIGLFARFNFLLPELSFVQNVVGYVFIAVGALAWWWLVSFFVDKVRSHFNLRSMWLINKITGSIIMIFAIVGIVTAVSSMARAASPQSALYMNSSRGFGPLDSATHTGMPLVIDNPSSDTVVRFIALDRADDFSFSFRAAQPSERGPWSVILHFLDRQSYVEISVDDKDFDELYPAVMRLRSVRDGSTVCESILTNGFEPGKGVNAYRLRRDQGILSFGVGNRKISNVLNLKETGYPDSVGFMLPPGSSLTVDHIILETFAPRLPHGRLEVSHFADPDVRSSYFARSTDVMEGEWEVFDRSLDELKLRLGGTYRLAVVADNDGYQLIYLSGARKNTDEWEPGTPKGRLDRTSFKGIYDVTWLNPAGVPIDGEIKAQYASPGVLNLQFVNHNSTLRLRKLSAVN